MKKIKEIEKALHSADEETRRDALRALQGSKLTDIRGLLFTAMGDDSWRVRKEAVEAFIAAGPDDDSIGGLLDLLRNEDNAGLRNSAAEAIIKMDTRAADNLIHLINDTDADVRKFVVDVMGTIGNPLFLATLLSALDDTDVNVAAAAAEHLGHIGDAAAVPELLRCIISNPSQLFRFSALGSLGKLTSHMSVPQEISVLAEQEILRQSVYECLGSIGDHTAAPILLNGFSARQKSQRKTAIKAWYRIFSRSSATVRQAMEGSLSSLKGSDEFQSLLDAFDTVEPELAEAVTSLIGIIGDTRGAATLLKACTNERLTGSALCSLKRLGAEGVEVLLDLYVSCDEVSRAAICSIIGAIGHRDGSWLIIKALGDNSPSVRKAAVSAAGRLSLIESIPAIVTLLDDSDSEVRSTVVACLQVFALFDPTLIRQVALQLGASENPFRRRDAAILYATVGDHVNLALLVKDEDPAVRRTAVFNIGKLHLSSHAGLLRMALVDEDPDVRIAAAEAIGETGGADDVHTLLHALDDGDCWVQCAVLKSIAKISDAQTFAAIHRRINRADGLLLICCLEQLEIIGTREAMELVESVLNNLDPEIVSIAIAILSRQGGEWLVANAGRLMNHPNEKTRVALVTTFAGLPSDDAHYVLQRALLGEQNEQVRLIIQKFLENPP